jgi:uncharacterized membrane protein YczE
VSQAPPPTRRPSLGGVVLLLYVAGFLGVIAAVVSATKLETPNAVKFVFAAISLTLSVLCFAVGIFIDGQRP